MGPQVNSMEMKVAIMLVSLRAWALIPLELSINLLYQSEEIPYLAIGTLKTTFGELHIKSQIKTL
jgi:hypothetical protein